MGNAASRASRRRSSQPKTKESPAYLFLEEELQEKIKEHGWFHDSVADVCHRQGELLDAKGSYRDAMDKFLEALDIRKNVFGDTHVVVAETLYGIACALEHQGSHAQAVDFFEEAIDVQELVCGPHSREVGDSKNMMGFSQYRLERNNDALGSLWGSLQIREQFEDERGVAETLFNIGLVHQQMGEHRDALGWYEKSLKSALKKGDSKLALQAVEEALPLMTVLHGKSTKTVATLHLQKGVLLDQEGMFEEAMDSFTAALDIRQNKLGRFHRSVAEVLYIMGCTHVHQDQFEEACDKFERAAAVQKKKIGMDSKEYGDSKNMLGYTQYKLGKLNDALANLSDSLGVRKLLDDGDAIAQTLATIKSVQKVARRTQPRRRPQRVQKSVSGSSNRSGRSTERDLSPIREGITEETEREEHSKLDDGSEFLRDSSAVPVSVSLSLPTLNGLSPAKEDNTISVAEQTAPAVTPESSILSSVNFQDPSGELTDSERTPDPSSEHADPSLELTDSERTPDPPAEPTDPSLELTDSERTPDPTHESPNSIEERQKEPEEMKNDIARSKPTPQPESVSTNYKELMEIPVEESRSEPVPEGTFSFTSSLPDLKKLPVQETLSESTPDNMVSEFSVNEPKEIPMEETKETMPSLLPETIDAEPTISDPKEFQDAKRIPGLTPEMIDSDPNLPELKLVALGKMVPGQSPQSAEHPPPEEEPSISQPAEEPTDEPTPATTPEEETAIPDPMENTTEDTKPEPMPASTLEEEKAIPSPVERTEDTKPESTPAKTLEEETAIPEPQETPTQDSKPKTIAEQTYGNKSAMSVNETVQPNPAAPAAVEATQPDIIDENAAELLSIDFDRDGDALKEALGEDVLAMWVEQDLYQDMPDLRNELLKGIVDIKFQNLKDEQAQLREKLKRSGIPVPEPMATPASPPGVLLDC